MPVRPIIDRNSSSYKLGTGVYSWAQKNSGASAISRGVCRIPGIETRSIDSSIRTLVGRMQDFGAQYSEMPVGLWEEKVCGNIPGVTPQTKAENFISLLATSPQLNSSFRGIFNKKNSVVTLPAAGSGKEIKDLIALLATLGIKNDVLIKPGDGAASMVSELTSNLYKFRESIPDAIPIKIAEPIQASWSGLNPQINTPSDLVILEGNSMCHNTFDQLVQNLRGLLRIIKKDGFLIVDLRNLESLLSSQIDQLTDRTSDSGIGNGQYASDIEINNLTKMKDKGYILHTKYYRQPDAEKNEQASYSPAQFLCELYMSQYSVEEMLEALELAAKQEGMEIQTHGIWAENSGKILDINSFKNLGVDEQGKSKQADLGMFLKLAIQVKEESNVLRMFNEPAKCLSLTPDLATQLQFPQAS